MNINLESTKLFEQNEILFDKNVNFVFGKNGTGKSTLCKLIKEQLGRSYDVRIFQGFESVVGENNKLNTVILGEENTEINEQIKIKEQEKHNKKLEIDKIKEIIEQSEQNPNNLWQEFNEKQRAYNEIQYEIEDFCTDSARDIKNHSPQISVATYRKDDFKRELDKGNLLEPYRIEELERILRSEVKNATKLDLAKFTIDFKKLIEDVNEILQEKVQERTRITRLEGMSGKIQFAQDGLHLHKAGDYCSFCNNIISKETIAELETYFSADEVKALESKIKNKMTGLEQIRYSYAQLSIREEDFYPDLCEAVKNTKDKILMKVKDITIFIDFLLSSLGEKLKNLFKASDLIGQKQPESVFSDIKMYNDLVEENNASELIEKQEQAKSELRYHLIKKYCNEFNYNLKKNDLDNAKVNLDEVYKKIHNEKEKIEILSSEIKSIDEEIKNLQERTRNERVFVEKINKKLKLYVSFELAHQEKSNDYQIKCLRTNKIRSVTELSTGEKNIIAFLYFIQKLDDISELPSQQNQYVVFDDPMNSNDDAVQYLIIEELQKLAEKIEGNNHLVILTHNNHFYMNVKYGFKYNENKFYHFVKLNHKTNIKHISNKDNDFNTSYGALWNELKVIIENENVSSSLLLNPIRRIIETYTKFNGISQNKFFKNTSGARKLFNVNSHSIDDLEAELNGKDKKGIIGLLKNCFESNNALEHFNQHMGEGYDK